MKMKWIGIIFLFLIGCKQETVNDGDVEATDSTSQDSLSVEKGEVVFAIQFKGERLQCSIEPVDKNFFLNTKDFPLPKADKIIELKCEDPSEDCEKKIEKVNIEPFAKYVARHGDSLLLKCGVNDSSFVSFVTEPSDEDDFATYSFVHKYDNPDVYLVAGTYWESYDYKLINRKTCKVIDIIGVPVFSPDRRKAVTINEDLVAGFTFNGMELLTFRDTTISVDARQEFDRWGIESASWISNDEIKLVQVTANYESDKADKEANRRYAILKMK